MESGQLRNVRSRNRGVRDEIRLAQSEKKWIAQEVFKCIL
jgi:hypothetical protein